LATTTNRALLGVRSTVTVSTVHQTPSVHPALSFSLDATPRLLSRAAFAAVMDGAEPIIILSASSVQVDGAGGHNATLEAPDRFKASHDAVSGGSDNVHDIRMVCSRQLRGPKSGDAIRPSSWDVLPNAITQLRLWAALQLVGMTLPRSARAGGYAEGATRWGGNDALGAKASSQMLLGWSRNWTSGGTSNRFSPSSNPGRR
jgi:hypothetical protein